MDDRPPYRLEWTDDLVERFWSFYGDKIHTYFAESFGPAIVRKSARWLPRGAICIDYGCGSGGLTSALLAAGHKVGAVDYTAKSVAHVQKRFGGHGAFLGARTVSDLAEAPFPAADAVFSVETIEHVTEPHIAAYFASISRLLKPNGLAIFSTPNNEDIEAACVFCPQSGAIFHPMQHVRSFDGDRLTSFLGAHGFETVLTFVTDFGLSLRANPKTWIADKGKRLLGMGAPYPHLVAVARRRAQN